jgi:hypothetical protein
MNKGSYNIERLNNFLFENKIKILKSEPKITRNTIITGFCKTINCKNMFSKNFRTLIKNNSYYCEDCMIKIIVDKRKNTNLKNCGFTTNLICPKTKEKIKKTTLQKFGCEHNSQSQLIKDKKIKTCYKNYNVNFPTQSKEIQEKIKNVNITKYGVEYPNQNAEYAENIYKKQYKFKEYVFPSGKIQKIQGYENYALDELIINEKIEEQNIITGIKNVPEIWYNDANNKKHRHYVDIYIPNQNRCIEVKSTWTLEKKKDNVFIKQSSAKKLGYNYEIWVYDRKGNNLEKYF